MKRLFLFLLLFPVLSLHGWSLLRYSTDTGVGNQPGFFWWYDDAACPSGMARCNFDNFISTQTALITLPVTLTNGNYNAYLKVNALDTSGGTATNLVVGLTAGGATVETIASDINADGLWTTLGVLNVPANTNVITFNWRTINGASLKAKNCSVIAVYITTDSGFIITKDDYIQYWNLSTNIDTSTPIPGNLIPNSSFELGAEGYSLYPNTAIFFTAQDTITTNTAAHGSKSFVCINEPCNDIPAKVRSREGKELSSAVIIQSLANFLVRPNKPHTLQFMAKSEPAGGKIQAKIKHAVTPPVEYGFPNQPTNQTSAIILTTNWTQYTLSNFVMRDYPSPAEYYLSFEYDPLSVLAGTRVYLDAIQLEEGPVATTYAPSTPVEVACKGNRYGNTFYVEENNTDLTILVYNSTASQQARVLTYQIFDRTMTPMIGVTNGYSFVPGFTTLRVNANSLPYGAFRLTAWLDQGGSESETYFSRIRRPPSIPRGQSIFGNHMEYWWGNNQIAHRRGYTMSRFLSPVAALRWSFVEPSPDNWSYADDLMDVPLQETEAECPLSQARAAWANRTYLLLDTVTGPGFAVGETATQGAVSGVITWVGTAANATGPALQFSNVVGGTMLSNLTITGSTSGTTARQASASQAGSPAIDRYTNYVAHLVGHFTNKFLAYEIMNEPHLDTSIPKMTNVVSPIYYGFAAEMTRQATRAAKAVYPDVKLIGMGGISTILDYPVFWDLFDDYTKTNLHATSIHLYEGVGVRTKDFVSWAKNRGGPPIWNTEAGVNTFSQFYGSLAIWRNNGTPLLQFRDSEDFMKTWNECLDIGPFNMLATIGGEGAKYFYYYYGLNQHYGDPSAYTVQLTPLDLNDIAKPMDVAQSFVMWALDGGVGKGAVAAPTNTYCFQFQAPWNTPWITLRSVDRTNRVMTSTLTNGIQVEGYTIQGNPLPLDTPNVIKYGQIPVMLKAINGTTMAQMSNAVMAATFGREPDTTPPHVVFGDYPKGLVDNLHKHLVRIRWLAWDNFYTSRRYFDAVNVRFKLDSDPMNLPSQLSFVEYPNLASGAHTFTIEATDSAGLSTTNSLSFTIQ